jgi:hypothetical protein
MPLTSLELDLLLGEYERKFYDKESLKLKNLKNNLETQEIISKEKQSSYLCGRFKNSVDFHQKQFDEHSSIWNDRKLKIEDNYQRAKRDLEESYNKNKELFHKEELGVRLVKENNLEKAKKSYDAEVNK